MLARGVGSEVRDQIPGLMSVYMGGYVIIEHARKDVPERLVMYLGGAQVDISMIVMGKAAK